MYRCTTFLDELHKMDENNLRKTSYATEQLIVSCYTIFLPSSNDEFL
jgi:hypothetical protein